MAVTCSLPAAEVTLRPHMGSVTSLLRTELWPLSLPDRRLSHSVRGPSTDPGPPSGQSRPLSECPPPPEMGVALKWGRPRGLLTRPTSLSEAPALGAPGLRSQGTPGAHLRAQVTSRQGFRHALRGSPHGRSPCSPVACGTDAGRRALTWERAPAVAPSFKQKKQDCQRPTPPGTPRLAHPTWHALLGPAWHIPPCTPHLAYPT